MSPCVESFVEDYNTGMQARELERIFKAFANARRLSILSYLKRRRSATVGEIAEHIRLSFKSTSKHLIILRSAGILEFDQSSLEMYYRIASKLPPEARTLLSVA